MNSCAEIVKPCISVMFCPEEMLGDFCTEMVLFHIKHELTNEFTITNELPARFKNKSFKYLHVPVVQILRGIPQMFYDGSHDLTNDLKLCLYCLHNNYYNECSNYNQYI